MYPGEIIPGKGSIVLNEYAATITISVTNTSEQAVQVTSHYHFFEANKRLQFERRSAYGRRLDLPSGSAVRWQPGETREVQLIDIKGRRRIFGFQGLVNGRLTDEQRGQAIHQAHDRGFLDQEN